MRKIIIILACTLVNCLIVIFAYGQAPQAIAYQAVARDSNNNPLISQNIGLRFSIHESLSNGNIVYQETQTITTTSLGLFSVNIGQGIPVSGTLSSVNWAIGSKYLQTEMDVNGGTNFTTMGTTQLMSVPYALSSSDNQWTKNGNSISNNNAGQVGIGTSNPSAKLDVIGKIKMTDGTQGNGKVLKSDGLGIARWDSIKASDILSTTPSISLECPNLISTLTMGGYPYAIDVSGNYAYITTFFGNTLNVVNITNPSAPIMVGAVSTGLTPYAVAVSGNYAYVVNNGSNNLQVIDISTPTAPIIVGSVATGSGPTKVEVVGNYAYVVNNISHSLQIIDISNPSTPMVVGSVITGSFSNAVAISGNYAYVVNSSNTMQVINISVPSAPTIVGTVSVGVNATSIGISGNYAYVGTSNSMQVINISTPTSPIVVGSVATGNLTNTIALTGNYAIVLNNSGSTIQVIDISIPSAPTIVAYVPALGSGAFGGALSGHYFYSVFGDNTMKVHNLLCNVDYAITYNPSTGLTSALPHSIPWNASGNNISNANSGNVNISTKLGIGNNTAPQNLLAVGESTSDAQQVGIRSFGNTPSGWKGGAAFGYTIGSVIMGELNGVPTIGAHNADLSGWYHLAINPDGGNVGIGNPNPNAKLDILGNIKIADGTQGNGKVLMSDANGLASWQSTSSLPGSLSNGTSIGNTPYWNGTSWITNSSNLFNNGSTIGIGTTGPYRTLDVRGDIAQGMWLDNIPNRRIGVMNNSLQVAGMEIENTTLGGNYSQKLHLLTHHIGASTDRRLTIDEDGNVGIGIQTPTNKLSVQGNANITGFVSSNSMSTTNLTATNITTLPTGSITTNTIISPNISSSKFKVSEIWNNAQGVPTSSSFTCGGGTLMLNISSMAYQITGNPATLTIQVLIDGLVVTDLKGFASQNSSQIPLTSNFKVITGLSAGTHIIQLVPVAPTIMDINSYTSASILELPF